MKELNLVLGDSPLEQVITRDMPSDPRTKRYLTTMFWLRTLFLPVSIGIVISGMIFSLISKLSNVCGFLTGLLYPLVHSSLWLNLRWFGFSNEEAEKLYASSIAHCSVLEKALDEES
jgi:hypothetical protein